MHEEGHSTSLVEIKGPATSKFNGSYIINSVLDCYIKIFQHSVSNRYDGTSISEIGEEALDEAEELVEARSKSQCLLLFKTITLIIMT